MNLPCLRILTLAVVVVTVQNPSHVTSLTVDIPDNDDAGLPSDGQPMTVKIVKVASLLTVPDEPPRSPPKIPQGKSICANESDSGDQSPIALGRATRWPIKGQGSGGTKELARTGQRVMANLYYGRLRDRFYIQNDGYNLVFYLNESQPTSELTLKLKEWDDEYVFAKGILHWGSLDEYGSEHALNGRRFPMEIELIHYRAGIGSLEKAAGEKNGLTVISVLFDFSGFEKKYLDAIIRQASAVAQPGAIKQVHGPLYLAGLFPGTLEHFEYSGSMTTEPCGKAARRIVFTHPVGIGRDQLHILRTIVRNLNGTPMIDNYRDLQPGNGGAVFNPTLGQLDVQYRDSLVKPAEKRHW